MNLNAFLSKKKAEITSEGWKNESATLKSKK